MYDIQEPYDAPKCWVLYDLRIGPQLLHWQKFLEMLRLRNVSDVSHHLVSLEAWAEGIMIEEEVVIFVIASGVIVIPAKLDPDNECLLEPNMWTKALFSCKLRSILVSPNRLFWISGQMVMAGKLSLVTGKL